MSFCCVLLVLNVVRFLAQTATVGFITCVCVSITLHTCYLSVRPCMFPLPVFRGFCAQVSNVRQNDCARTNVTLLHVIRCSKAWLLVQQHQSFVVLFSKSFSTVLALNCVTDIDYRPWFLNNESPTVIDLNGHCSVSALEQYYHNNSEVSDCPSEGSHRCTEENRGFSISMVNWQQQTVTDAVTMNYHTVWSWRAHTTVRLAGWQIAAAWSAVD